MKFIAHMCRDVECADDVLRLDVSWEHLESQHIFFMPPPPAQDVAE